MPPMETTTMPNNKLSAFTNEVLQVQQLLLHNRQHLTVNFLFQSIMHWYLLRSKRRLGKGKPPIKTKSLQRRLVVTLKALETLSSNVPYILLKRLEQKVMTVIQMVNNQFNLLTKQAPLLPMADAFRIANHLWHNESRTRGTTVNSIPTRKRAATVLVLASLSGARWIDLHRIHWNDIQFENDGVTKVMRVPLRMSKNNLCNEVPQRLFWMVSSSTTSARNPIKWLKRFWKWQGRPKSGFVFGPTRHGIPNKNWGNDTIRQIQRTAKLLGFPADKIPTKHSPRVTMAVTLYNLGVDAARINRFLNWKTGRMQEHYINTRDSQALGAPAHKLSTISASDMSAVQKYFL